MNLTIYQRVLEQNVSQCVTAKVDGLKHKQFQRRKLNFFNWAFKLNRTGIACTLQCHISTWCAWINFMAGIKQRTKCTNRWSVAVTLLSAIQIRHKAIVVIICYSLGAWDCQNWIHHIRQGSTLLTTWVVKVSEERQAKYLSLCCAPYDKWLCSDPGQAKIVTHYTSSPRMLLNICCTGDDSSSRNPGHPVVLGYSYQSSIGRKHMGEIQDMRGNELLHHVIREIDLLRVESEHVELHFSYNFI